MPHMRRNVHRDHGAASNFATAANTGFCHQLRDAHVRVGGVDPSSREAILQTIADATGESALVMHSGRLVVPLLGQLPKSL